MSDSPVQAKGSWRLCAGPASRVKGGVLALAVPLLTRINSREDGTPDAESQTDLSTVVSSEHPWSEPTIA
jgi:hypothetical protein